MSTKKKYIKRGELCKVTFRMPQEACPGAKTVMLVGDFNNWSIKDHPMRKLKSGEFSLELGLEANREYQFRYLIDEETWENDWEADKYVKSEYGNCENSVIIV